MSVLLGLFLLRMLRCHEVVREARGYLRVQWAIASVDCFGFCCWRKLAVRVLVRYFL